VSRTGPPARRAARPTLGLTNRRIWQLSRSLGSVPCAPS
jgi:hypothetical protein